MSGYPVQLAKVQRPPLRDETLGRDRLLDWLHVKVHHRAVFVIAEAGYGKTTLLADFARRTRLRTLWYRLDEEDRNWIAFVSYLVSAGREVDTSFAPATAGLLQDLGTTGPSLDTVLETFVREFQALGEEGAVVVLDDYHVVDDAPDIRLIVRELFARAPERVTFVIASRRPPTLPVARLRALGEVADLTTDDLRFNGTETEQLFRETYGRPLEPDVLSDLSQRTEGWAASLQLVQAAIRGRSTGEVRSFVRSLSGAEGELYDYLAEEVIASLPPDEQAFVMRCAILESVEPRLAAIVTDMEPAEVTTYIDKAVRAGLLARPSRRGAASRYHPLVQQFLLERLTRELGPDSVTGLNRRVADSSPDDWRIAARHYAQAGDQHEVIRTIGIHLAAIVSQGAYEEASRMLPSSSVDDRPAELQILLSRIDVQRGRLDRAAARASEALDATEQGSLSRDLALANLLNIAVNVGDGELARGLATSLREGTGSSSLRAIADATLRLIDVSKDGQLVAFRAELEAMASHQLEANQLHYYGVTMLNVAECLRVEGAFVEAFHAASCSIPALEQSSAGMELAMAYSIRAWASAHSNGIDAARGDAKAALKLESPIWRLQVLSEIAEITGFYGNPQEAVELLDDIDVGFLPASVAIPLLLAKARGLLRVGRHEEAQEVIDRLPPGSAITTPAFEASLRVTQAMTAIATDSQEALCKAEEAARLANKQGAGLWRLLAAVVRAAAGDRDDFGRRIHQVLAMDATYLSMMAELIAPRLDLVSQDDLATINGEARLRPTRWRVVLRDALDSQRGEVVARAALMLDGIGDTSDIVRLRAIARRHRKNTALASIGRPLARRLAPRVVVEDCGRVTILVGNRPVANGAIRRKVLALLCFLLSEKDLSATRDQALDALWPDLDPGQALNSLNQTLYFLRRVIEPEYEEDLSPGYVHHEAEVIWLEPSLIDSRSNRCRALIRSLPPTPDPGEVEALSKMYLEKFARDFEYEEWASQYRDWLHTSYLEVVERAVQSDTNSGHYGRGIRLAQRALEVDPDAEQIELSLLRLYRLAGAHSAAAEQYEHYARVLRNTLGVEPPPLEAL